MGSVYPFFIALTPHEGYGEQTSYITHLHSDHLANHKNSKLTGVLGNAPQKIHPPYLPGREVGGMTILYFLDSLVSLCYIIPLSKISPAQILPLLSYLLLRIPVLLSQPLSQLLNFLSKKISVFIEITSGAYSLSYFLSSLIH